MKYMKVLVAIFGSLIIIIILASMYRAQKSSEYKYTISYNKANHNSEDYTNEFEYLPGNATIRYVNESGDSVYRSGSFYIQENKK